MTASSWLNDLRDQVERTRVLNVVYRSASALGSRLPSIATAKAKVAGAGALLRPVSTTTQVVFLHLQNKNKKGGIFFFLSFPFFTQLFDLTSALTSTLFFRLL